MKTPGPSLSRSTRRFLWPALLLVLGTQQTSLAQDNAVHTAADFEAARKQADDARSVAKSALDKNRDLRNQAEAAANSLNSFTASRDANASAATVLTNIDPVLQSLRTNGKLTDLLGQATTNATTQKTSLQTPRDVLFNLTKDTTDFNNLSDDLHNRVVQTLSDCDAALKQLDNESSLNAASSAKIQDALAKIVAQAIDVTASFSTSLDPLKNLPAVDPDPKKVPDDTKKNVLKVTGKYLPVFVDIVGIKRDYRTKWTPVLAKLQLLVAAPDPNSKAPAPLDVGKNLDALDTKVSAIGGCLKNWLNVVKEMPVSETQALEKGISDVDADAPANTASATVELRKANGLRELIKNVEDSWNRLVPIIDQLGVAELAEEDVTAGLAELTKNSHALFGALSRLQEAIVGDFSEFEADQQQLFYFTDVPRLMQMLNSGVYEIGGIKGAQEQAAAQRQKLAQSELDLAAAQADVNSYQTRLMQLPEELKQVRADARKQDSVYGKTSNRLTSLTDRLSAATGKVNTLKSAPTAASAADNQKTQSDLAQAQKDKDRLTAQNADAQRDNANALHDKDVADQKLKSAEDEQTGIPAQIEKAKLALSAAQNNVAQRRRESLLAAQAESDAFGFARDNTPYWFAPASGISKDPARRVEMYGTNDSKIVYLRGKRADLDAVKDIIERIDLPEPQARLTIWSLQLNYTTDKGTLEKVNQALKDVEDRLAMIRTRMAASVSLLRDAVNERVNQAAETSNCSTADDCRLERIINTYDIQVLLQLGLDRKNPGAFKSLSRWTVPDPAGTATLAEALLILSLAKPSIRQAAFDSFLDHVERIGKDRKWSVWHEEDKPRHLQDKRSQDWKRKFPNTQRVLNLDLPFHAINANELTSTQAVVAEALQAQAYTRLLSYFDYKLGQLRRQDAFLAAQCSELASIISA